MGTHRYDDILDLPHHQSPTRRHMTMAERAAQFSPFAALTGFGAVIGEAGRLTEERIELTDEEKEEIGRTLRDAMEEGVSLSVTWFEPDALKAGGRYVTLRDAPDRYDPTDGAIVFRGGERIPVEAILRVEAAGEDAG